MFKGLLARFLKQDEGGVYIFAGLSIVVLVGFVGMAIDIGQWMTERRQTQAAADAAAIAAALEAARGASSSDIIARARVVASSNGYTSGTSTSGGTQLVALNNPPIMGSKAGDSAYYEAVVRTQLSGLFSRIVHPGATSISTRAVATTHLMDSCVYALDPTASGAITFAGTADVSMDCSFLSNSTSGEAIKQAGGSCVAAEGLGAVGGVDINDPSCVSVPNVQGSQPAAEDPFAYLNPPSPNTLSPGNPWCSTFYSAAPVVLSGSGNPPLLPGCYRQGLRISTTDVATMNPGLYLIGGTGFNVTSGGVHGSDLTIYFPPTASGSSGVLVSIAGGTDVHLSASHPDYPGILFYQDPNMTPKIIQLTGGANMELNGVIYFPQGDVTFAGNSSGGTDWTVLVSKTVQFTGGASFATSTLPGTTPLSVSIGTLVE